MSPGSFGIGSKVVCRGIKGQGYLKDGSFKGSGGEIIGIGKFRHTSWVVYFNVPNFATSIIDKQMGPYYYFELLPNEMLLYKRSISLFIKNALKYEFFRLLL